MCFGESDTLKAGGSMELAPRDGLGNLNGRGRG